MNLAALVARIQDLIARRIGLELSERSVVIRAMLEPRHGEGIGYWLQLMMAAALATLGLALDSTAVVIGAMLIAPLMKPIIELAMGLATGSAPLVFRAGLRSATSIAAVVIASAVISWMLPFHEITRELAARTAPSLIDLFVAAACALAGAYATMFSTSDMASTAAGTSIGISLVPPLCTLGYALSIGEWHMAVGAALLFTANVTGIITVAGVVFVVVGFGQVDVAAEDLAMGSDYVSVAGRIGRNWSAASKRLGAVSRLVLPLLLLAAIYIPLRTAVGEMTRRSEIRQELASQLASTQARVAQSSIEMGANGVVVRVVVVGDSQAAQELDTELRATLKRLGEPEARLSVWAVPDAKSMGALAMRLDDLPPPVVAEPVRDLAHHTPGEVLELVRHAWPKRGTGALVSAWMVDGTPLQIHVVHFGPPIGDLGLELLQRAVATTEPVVVVETAVESVDAPEAEAVTWVARALRMAEVARRLPGVALCITVPAPPPPPDSVRKRPIVEAASTTVVRDIVDAAFVHVPNAIVSRGDHWSLSPVLGACTPTPTPTPAPTPTPPTP